jgi:hypothetical protein
MLRALFALTPGISNDMAWTLTTVLYLFGHFIVYHWLTGAPFDSTQGEYDGLTLWEQIDNGAQFTPTKKYLTALPIMLYAYSMNVCFIQFHSFLMSAHYSHYNATLFAVNLVPLIIVLIAKLPAMHRVRFFGINKAQD